MRSIWVKPFILPLLESGRKPLEVRLATSFFLSIKVGEILCFNNSVQKRVVAVRRYSDFASMLEKEDSRRIHPDWPQETILNELKRIYGQREQLGILVFELGD